jgi:hypothetical protein
MSWLFGEDLHRKRPNCEGINSAQSKDRLGLGPGQGPLQQRRDVAKMAHRTQANR